MLRNLILDRPLAAIDIETTGLLDDGARVVELAVIRIFPDLAVHAGVVRLNPGMLIPPAATLIHGIDNAHVAGCPTFRDVLPLILDMLDGCDITGFNVLGFDLPVIQAELDRAGGPPLDLTHWHVIDSMTIFHRFYPPVQGVRGQHGLAAACRRYLGGASHGAHSALCDALAALLVLDSQIAHHRLSGRLAAILEATERLSVVGSQLSANSTDNRQPTTDN